MIRITLKTNFNLSEMKLSDSEFDKKYNRKIEKGIVFQYPDRLIIYSENDKFELSVSRKKLRVQMSKLLKQAFIKNMDMVLLSDMFSCLSQTDINQILTKHKISICE